MTKFRKQYREADNKIKAAFAQTLELFFEDSDHPFLRNHFLKGRERVLQEAEARRAA